MVGLDIEMASIGKDRNTLSRRCAKRPKTRGEPYDAFGVLTPSKASGAIHDGTESSTVPCSTAQTRGDGKAGPLMRGRPSSPGIL